MDSHLVEHFVLAFCDAFMPLNELPPPERPLVPSGNLPPETFFLPPPSSAPEDEDNTIKLEMGEYSYEGTLTTNWNKRITRLNELSVTVLRVLYRLMGAINFNFNLIIKLPNPFDLDRDDETKNLKYEGWFAIMESLRFLHLKVDNLSEDLQHITPVASVVEHWQLKKESLRPQCIFLFGEWSEGEEKIGSPKWQTAVPYFDFGRAASFDNSFGYWKGPHQGILTLDDNSKVIVYCRDEDEITRLFNRYLEGIRGDMKAEVYIKMGEYKGPPFSTRYVRLRRLDYYSTGQLRGPMDNYRWYPARPGELPPIAT